MHKLGMLPPLTVSTAVLLTVSSLVGAAVAGYFYLFNFVDDPKKYLHPVANQLLAYDFYTPSVYKTVAISPIDKLSRSVDWLDRNVVDGLVNLVGATSLFGGESLKYFNSGRGQSYVLTIILGIAILGFYLGLLFVPKLL